ncbi:MAG: AEC family transporter [Oscillospiraceae bacterium]|nr:AEC family transporter [Oscillospiraceae bacterium]
MFDGILYFLIFLSMGYVLIRSRALPEGTAPILSSLLMTVCFPAMILKSFLTVDVDSLLHTGLPTVLVTLIFSLLPAGILLLRRKPMAHGQLYPFICGIGNVSFVCIPLMNLFLTPEQMFPVYLHVAVQDLLIWAVFHPAFAGKTGKLKWRKLLTEPCLLAVFVGLILGLSGLKLPSFLQGPIDALDACVSPLALVFLGMTIGQYGLCSWWGKKEALGYTLYKVIFYPAVVFLCLIPFFTRWDTTLLALLFASPAPVAGVIWMQRYTEDPAPAIHCLIPSTLLYFALYGPILLLLTG